MARRRKRKKRQFPKITLFLCVTALIIGFGVAGAQLLPAFLKTAEEAVSLVGQQKVEFPELTVTAEEVARDFYYQQLNSEEQTVYRELLQGVTGMEERLTRGFTSMTQYSKESGFSAYCTLHPPVMFSSLMMFSAEVLSI